MSHFDSPVISYILFDRFALPELCFEKSNSSGGGAPKIHRLLGRNTPAQIRSEFPRKPKFWEKILNL